MNILLGGVPFGNGNIGDDAILNCVVSIFRRNFPHAEISAATFAQESTGNKHHINTLPAFGFDPAYSMRDFRRAVKNFDMFVWAGGTGLSDYPHIGASLLENAQAMHVKTVIWQVGMNREFNPEYFQLHGRKLKFAELFGMTRYFEHQMEKRIRERLQVCVAQCDLVVLRDQPSLIELHNSGEFPAAYFGADSVILQTASDNDLVAPDARNRRSIGICMAEKLSRNKFKQAIAFMQKLQDELNVRLLFIPMTPGDRAVMEPILQALDSRQENKMLIFSEPEDIQKAVKSCSLLLSGRLQLTIMGLNAMIPGIGIANSSKIANCLNMFGLPVFNNHSSIDFDQLFDECVRWLDDPDFQLRAQAVRTKMLARLEQCEKYLKDLAL